MNLKFQLGAASLASTLRALTRNYVNPQRDWTIGLTLGGALFLAGVMHIALDFYNQFGAVADTAAETTSPVIYREKEVRYYSRLYADREQEFSRLRGERPREVTTPAPAVESTTTEPTLAEGEVNE